MLNEQWAGIKFMWVGLMVARKNWRCWLLGRHDVVIIELPGGGWADICQNCEEEL